MTKTYGFSLDEMYREHTWSRSEREWGWLWVFHPHLDEGQRPRVQSHWQLASKPAVITGFRLVRDSTPAAPPKVVSFTWSECWVDTRGCTWLDVAHTRPVTLPGLGAVATEFTGFRLVKEDR